MVMPMASSDTTIIKTFFFLFAIFSLLGNYLNQSSPLDSSLKASKPLPVETIFKLPSPLPTWPPGEGFASGTIGLGGLEVCQISSFTKTWATHEGGPEDLGATFFEPASLPDGFSMLGSYAQPNNRPLFGWVLAARDLTAGALKQPVDYTLVWSSNSSKIKQDGNGYIWLPKPPDGYKAVGHLVTSSPEKPPLDKVRCVRSDFADVCETDGWIWGRDKFDVYGLQPSSRGIQAQGFSAGTFTAQTGSISCLKNAKGSSSSMPNLNQIRALIQAYSPWIYFHPDEQYLPSSVSWFLKNGALLYKKGEEFKPVSIDPLGSDLPLNGSSDGAYWLDLPADPAAKEQVKKGNLQDAGVYLHVKPMLGATFTDVAIWVFYPFNGAAKAKVKFINVSLGKIGEHVGDWEHVTLRVSNFDGELKSVYFSQHNGGMWLSASELEFQGGNKPVTYAALHSHAICPRTGVVVLGNGGVGVRMEAGRGNLVMDTAARFVAVGAEQLGSAVVEPPWLNYAGEWGPKISYDIAEETEKVEKLLPGLLKATLRKMISSLPAEVLGEQGPTGPKWKDNWIGDER
ncbi:hypothetical protein At1g04090-like [Diospyros lotus]|uniref:hypothetical protein At1g04090-like n=1 Tax=Diospyros lotus TaxID=55363 RepID=UPI00225B6066|nr:hypothetical protein At1g04090-like [Diospyros lotus]